MNDASGLESGKTTELFTERKVIHLPKRAETFTVQHLLEKSSNRGNKGLVTVTSGFFDARFVLTRIREEQPVDERKVVVGKLSIQTTDLEVLIRLGRGKSHIGFVDVHHLLIQEEDSATSVFPACGSNYFFAYDHSCVLCLCVLSRDGDGGWRLHYHEIGQRRPNRLFGTLIHRLNSDSE